LQADNGVSKHHTAQQKTLKMKKVLITLCCALLLGCNDAVDLSKSTSELSRADDVTTNNLTPFPVPQYVWKSAPVVAFPGPYPTNDATSFLRTITVDGKAYWFFGSVGEFIYKLNTHTMRWEEFDGPESIPNIFFGGYSHLFSYDKKYYFGFRPQGGDPDGEDRAIYAHDILTANTDDIPDFPGSALTEVTFVVAGSKAYVLGGRKGNLVSNQYWELDLITNQWTNKGGLPGGPRCNARAYVVDNKIYYGLGYDLTWINGQMVKKYKTDWYSLTPGATVAASRADFPGEKRWQADGFVIKNKIYVGWGRNNAGDYLNDFWEFNPANNQWMLLRSVILDFLFVERWGNIGDILIHRLLFNSTTSSYISKNPW
jgi:hypothetical protein